MTTATATITIKSINTRPEIDPFHRDTRGITRTCIQLDPEEGKIEVFQIEDSNSTPMHVWHGRILRWIVSQHPSEADMRNRLMSNMSRFERICNGFSVEWDGSNHVGRLTEDGRNAEESIDEDIAQGDLEAIDYWQVWGLHDWFDATEDEVIGMSDAEIRRFVQASMLADRNIVLLFDEDKAVEHLIWYRDERTD